MFHYTIGIAGHIDHGKTTLTKALTGIETDRLKEEKERNISIEPGYAHFTLPNGQQVGVVDVPGHERFIRQMISGVAGIDLVLLVVAANEGIMPQTREHLEILHLLGIKKGIWVITKIDMVEQDYIKLVYDEIMDESFGTFMENAPIVTVSAKSGEGIDPLIAHIQKSLANTPARGTEEPFRLPIDRVFTVKGAGTVVTGTVFEGKVQIGDTLRLLPLDREVRVRQIQVHHQKAEAAYAGQRAAINVTGVEHDEVHRGDWLLSPNFLQATTRVDVHLKSLEMHGAVLKHRSRINVYAGTSEVPGILLLFDRKELLPGDQVYAQVVLDEPIVVKRDDPFLLRRPTPPLTIGGGTVVRAYGKKYRHQPATVEKMKKEHLSSLTERIESLLEERVMTMQELASELTIPIDRIREMEGSSYIQYGSYLANRSFIEKKQRELLGVLDQYHRANPSQYGMKRSELKERMRELPGTVLDWMMDDLLEKGQLRIIGERMAHGNFTPHLQGALQSKAESMLKVLLLEGLEVSDWNAIAEKHGLTPKQSEQILRFFIASGKIIKVSDKWVWPVELWEKTVERLGKRFCGQTFSIAEIREELGLSRKYLIPILEKLDQLGYTERIGDIRVWKKETPMK